MKLEVNKTTTFNKFGKIEISIFLLVFVLLVSSCSYRLEKNKQSEIAVDQAMLEKVSYLEVNEKILTPKCVVCHGDSGNVNLETYSAVYGHIDKIKEVTITTSTMPKAPYPALSEEERILLSTWIKAGAPEKALGGVETTPPPPPVEVVKPTFASIKKKILESKCNVCHSKGQIAEDVPLSSPEEMIDSPRDIVIPGDPDSSEFYLVVRPIARKIMPPKTSGIAPLNPEEVEVIKEWILKGAKD